MPEERDSVRERLEAFVGNSMGEKTTAPDEVNIPMIRHWVAAFDDQNPVYLDEDAATKSRFGGIVAPPAMLQAWTMPTPKIEGIAERGGAPTEMQFENPVSILDEEGYVGTLATNSELDFYRYLRPGDRLELDIVVSEISPKKKTSLATGYFVTWITTYRVGDEVVGRQLFRIFKFDPATMGGAA